MDHSLIRCVEEFLVARRSAKPSRHTERAWQSDFAAISSALAAAAALPAERLALEDLTPSNLRRAFGRFAADHSAASVARAWSSWNQFLSFLVAEDAVAGNPMRR